MRSKFHQRVWKFKGKFLFVFLTVSCNAVFAQTEIYGDNIYHVSETAGTLYVIGEIGSANDFELRRALRDHNISTIVLNSPGGSVFGGLSLAGIVGDRELRVYIPEGAVCASACAYIYFAGSERRAYGDLGVHQFASSATDTPVQLGDAQQQTQAITAEILGFLREFDTPAFVAERMFRSPEMYWFTPSELLELQSEIFGLDYATKYKIDSTFGQLNEAVAQRDEVEEQKFTQEEIIAIVQSRLNELGCDAGVVDGVLGPRTMSSIRRFLDNIGMSYKSDIIYDIAFIEALGEAEVGICPVLSAPRRAVPSTSAVPIPLAIASHWELKCKSQNGSTISTFFARVLNYNNRSGAISFILRGLSGEEVSVHGTVRPGAILVYDHTGRFNENYTRFDVGNADCPGGITAIALT